MYCLNVIKKMPPKTRNNQNNTYLSEKDVTEKPGEVIKLLNELLKSQSFLSDKFDDFNRRTQLLEKENSELKNEVQHLKQRIVAIESGYNELQYEYHKKQLFISGVPQTDNECLEKIINNIAEITNTKLTSDNISSCKRQPIHKNNEPAQIIVEFDSVLTKEEFLKNQKTNGPIIRNQLNINVADRNSCNNKIYVNEYLSNYNKKILYEAKKLKVKYNIKFIWAKHGLVYIRKNEQSPSFRIKNIESLTNIEAQLAN